MTKQRSGIPSGDDSDDSTPKAADGWPKWMGDAIPSLAPKQPPPARPKPAPAAAPAARRAAPVRPAAPVSPDPAPAAAPSRNGSWRGLRSLVCGIVLLLAFVAGELAARWQPEAAVRFQQAAADAQARLASMLPSSARWPVAVGVPLFLFFLLVWQAARPRRPLFLSFAFFLCLGTASIGMIRGGHEVDAERSVADFKGRVHSLRQELVDWKQTAVRTMSDKDRMTQALSKLELKLQETEADRSRSSLALQERDQIVVALRKEIEELRKKLAEKE